MLRANVDVAVGPRHPAEMSRVLLFLGLGIVIGAGATCAANSNYEGVGGGNGSGGSGGIAFTDGAVPDGNTGAGGLDPDAACGLITEQAKSTPLNLYVMFDKSSSMAGSKWNSAKLGLGAFVNDPASAGVKVALNFFPLDNNPTCDQFAYLPPVVPFAALPMNAQPIIDQMNKTTPNGFLTPIYPAVGGAILGAKEQKDMNPGEEAAALLVTDGAPDGPNGTCAGVDPNDPAQIAMLAKNGSQMFGVKTFVIGLPGVNQSIANQIAAAGGTGSAIVVGNLNVQQAFQDALAKVRGQALPCEYQLPADVQGGLVDTGLVNILLTPSGGMTDILPQNPTCNGAGWKYDISPPAKPTKIIICPASCMALKTDFNAKVQILLGCKTEVAK